VDGLEVRAAGPGDAAEIARVLTAAFYGDPLVGWILPSERSRYRRLRRIFGVGLRHESLRHGGVDVAWADGRIVGAAIWFPPETWSAGTEVSALPGYLRALGRRVVAVTRYESAAVRVHPREQPHWYLSYLGVDPALQGHGIGAALLRSRLAQCDEEGLPAYLESSNVENDPLYEHFGFNVTAALDLPEGAPVVNPMWRPAAFHVKHKDVI